MPTETKGTPKGKRSVTFVVVVVALAVLIVIGTGFFLLPLVVSNLRAHAWEMKSRALIHDLDLACNSYWLDNGSYPWLRPAAVTPTTIISGKEVYAALRGQNAKKEDYLGDVPTQFLKGGALVDPWGHEIQFRVDPETLKPVIWSCGGNGKDETNNGDSPDPAKFPKTYYVFGKGDTGDDISTR